jgi:DNA repair exonuclease SbcCD ATPase subunit
MHTRTRRATRKKSAVANTEDDETASNASYSASPAPSQLVLLPEDLLAAQDDLRSLLGVDVDLARPTAELLFVTYRTLLGVQEGTQAELVRKDVELEQVIQDHESRVSELENKLEENRQETEEERKKNAELSEHCSLFSMRVGSHHFITAAANATLNARLESMSAATSDNTVLSRRVEEVEREKRDLLLALDRLREDSMTTETELETVRTRLKETRAELATAQTEVAESKSSETTAKVCINSRL